MIDLLLKFSGSRRLFTFSFSSSGFTLIELLVVFSLIGVLSGVGFASFSSYGNRQVLNQASLDIKQAIDLARFDALSSVKPSACQDTDVLTGYVVNFCNFSQLQSLANCKPGGADYEVDALCGAQTITVLSKKFTQSVQLLTAGGNPSDCAIINFGTLNALGTGVPCKFNIKAYGNQSTINVDSTGYVSIQ